MDDTGYAAGDAMTGTMGDRVADAGRSARSGILSFYRGVSSKVQSVGGVTVAMVVLVLLIIVVGAYAVYRFMITSLKSTTLVDGPLHAKNNVKAIDSDKIPTLDNGLEFSLSFWIYLEGVNNTSNYKKVMTLGTTSEYPMLCVLDKTTNRMYIAFQHSTTSNKGLSGAEASITAYKQSRKSGGAPSSADHMVVAVEYIPLQRWVNICVVVNQDIVTLYLDGDIYSVSSVDAYVTGAGQTSATIAEPLGSLIIGSSSDGANAFVSRVQMFNYMISVYHARIVYNAGPVSRGLLGKMGLPRYKLQWPVTTTEDGTTDQQCDD